MDIGWGKSIREALGEYDLPVDFSVIKNMSKRLWNNLVSEKVEVMNRKRLLNECHKNEKGIQTPKTKTAHIIPELMTDTYKREPQEDIVQCTKHECKSLIIARFGMLECGRNFKGSLNELCNQCHQIDDKNHRLNYCIKYRGNNLYDSIEKENFKEIYSHNMDILRKILPKIGKVWNTQTAHGTMRV